MKFYELSNNKYELTNVNLPIGPSINGVYQLNKPVYPNYDMKMNHADIECTQLNLYFRTVINVKRALKPNVLVEITRTYIFINKLSQKEYDDIYKDFHEFVKETQDNISVKDLIKK